jgi:tryptophanyl-tRNA synthetase
MKIFMNFALQKKSQWHGKILTGVQSTGTPHLGNLLGATFPQSNYQMILK